MYDISNYDPGAFLTNLKNEALQKYNQQMGASGAGADISLPTASQATRVLTSKPISSAITGAIAKPVENFLYMGMDDAALQAERAKGLGQLLQTENPFSSEYYGYNPNFEGGSSRAQYIKEGLQSITGIDKGTGIGGGTPGSRAIYERVLKPVSKLIPGVGMVASGVDAVQRAQEGDYGGAALSAAGALPFVGIPATLTQYATDALGLTGQEREEPQEEINFSGLPIQVGSIYPAYFEDKEEFDRTGRGVYAGRPVYYSEGPDLPQGGLVYAGTAEDLENFYSSMQ